MDRELPTYTPVAPLAPPPSTAAAASAPSGGAAAAARAAAARKAKAAFNFNFESQPASKSAQSSLASSPVKPEGSYLSAPASAGAGAGNAGATAGANSAALAAASAAASLTRASSAEEKLDELPSEYAMMEDEEPDEVTASAGETEFL